MEKLKVTERAWNWIIWGIWWLLPHVNIQMCLVFEKLALQIVSVCWNVIGWFTSHELSSLYSPCVFVTCLLSLFNALLFILFLVPVILLLQLNLVISNSDNSNFRLYRGRTLVPAASHCNRWENISDLSNTGMSDSRLYRACSAAPHMSTASIIAKSTCLTVRELAGEMRHHTPPTLSSHRHPCTVTCADALQRS